PYIRKHTIVNVELDKEDFEELKNKFPVKCKFDSHESSHLGTHGYTTCAAKIAKSLCKVCQRESNGCLHCSCKENSSMKCQYEWRRQFHSTGEEECSRSELHLL
ncbi:hypothetical protein AVEN_105016-1, partial [Araneus ventricosus]